MRAGLHRGYVSGSENDPIVPVFRAVGGFTYLNYSGKSSDLRARMRTCFHENPSIHSFSSKAHSLK